MTLRELIDELNKFIDEGIPETTQVLSNSDLGPADTIPIFQKGETDYIDEGNIPFWIPRKDYILITNTYPFTLEGAN